MKSDFNKLLVERERYGHQSKFGDTRHSKNLNADADRLQVGGREGMRRRHKIAGRSKAFNENLNPLKGWLHSKLGKKWDKTYSELRKTFDARGVINNHILEHLFDYVEIHTKVVDDVVMVLDGYNGSKGYVPLKRAKYNQRYPDYYVCPRDGTLKTMMKQPRRSIIKERELEKQRKQYAVFRDLGDKHLHLEEDGIWYVYDVAPLPPVEIKYVRPEGPKDQLFEVRRKYGQSKKLLRWDEMNSSEQQQHGVRIVTRGLVTDFRTGKKVCRSESYQYKSGRRYGFYSYGQPTLSSEQYYTSKKQACHKLLRAHGIDAAATYDESKAGHLSHREAARYR